MTRKTYCSLLQKSIIHVIVKRTVWVTYRSCSDYVYRCAACTGCVLTMKPLLIAGAVTGWADSSNWNRKKAYTEQDNFACQVSV
jgi:hypothetical protein